MSAFLCSPKHISAVATWAAKRGIAESRQLFATVLARENIRSIAVRYPDTRADVVGKWMDMEEDDYFEDCCAEFTERLPHAAIHSLARSIDYQSCEHPGWQKSEAYRLLRKVIIEAGKWDPPVGAGRMPWCI
jgi:hypothetical protein